jgi:hypothetical protein
MSDDRSAVLADKLVADTIATFELMGTYLGVRLGWRFYVLRQA